MLVEQLAAVLDALAGADLHARTGPQLLEDTVDLVEARNRIDAELARRVRAADSKRAFAGDGQRTAQSWLRGHGRLSPSAASHLVRVGRALEQLPALAAAHAAGAITADQADLIGKITAPRPAALAAAQGVDLPAGAAVRAGFAAAHEHTDTARLVHTYLARLDADGPEPDPTEQRFLSIARHADGSATGRFHLDPLGAEKVTAALESLRQADRPAGDTRTRAQQSADALVQLADIHLGCGTPPLLRGVKPHAVVTVDAADLVDPATGPASAQLGCGGVLSAARARWAACDADLTRIVLGPDGEPLDLGRGPAAGARAERARRGGQRGPSIRRLRRPALVEEVHHLLHWALGGETSLANSGLLRERHHTQVRHGFRVERDTAGRWHTYRPDGTGIHVIRPPADDPELARAG
ncbi:DUF222 domain-containing protein [Geodermatophilus sp. SYSU D00815]